MASMQAIKNSPHVWYGFCTICVYEVITITMHVVVVTSMHIGISHYMLDLANYITS